MLDNVQHKTVPYAHVVRKGEGQQKAIFGFMALAGVRGGLGDNEHPIPQLVVGASIDLPWLSLSPRGRFSRQRITLDDTEIQSTHTEIGLGLLANRHLDLSGFSLALGLLVEGAYHQQSFDTKGTAPPRHSWSLGLGALASLEVELYRELVFLIEGGPMTMIYRQGIIEAGAETKMRMASHFTYWGAAGVGWKF